MSDRQVDTSSDSEDDDRRRRKRSPSSSSSEDDRKKRHKREKKHKKHKKDKKHRKEKKEKKNRKEKRERETAAKPAEATPIPTNQPNDKPSSGTFGPALPPGLQPHEPTPDEEEPVEEDTPPKRTLGPMRPEEHAKLQERVRQVYDEKSGRWRWVKGDGEIIERIVTKEQQKAIIKTVLKHAKYL